MKDIVVISWIDNCSWDFLKEPKLNNENIYSYRIKWTGGHRHFHSTYFSQKGLVPLGLTRNKAFQSDLVCCHCRPEKLIYCCWGRRSEVIRTPECLPYLGLSVIHGLIIKTMWTRFIQLRIGKTAGLDWFWFLQWKFTVKSEKNKVESIRSQFFLWFE